MYSVCRMYMCLIRRSPWARDPGRLRRPDSTEKNSKMKIQRGRTGVPGSSWRALEGPGPEGPGAYRCIAWSMRCIWTHQFPVPRGIVILISRNVFRHIRCEMCVSHTGKNILAAATGEPFELPFFPHTFLYSVYFCILILLKRLTSVRLNFKKKKERKYAHRAVHLPSRRTGRAFKSRNSQVGRDRPAVDM
jgi:hypothetical protein